MTAKKAGKLAALVGVAVIFAAPGLYKSTGVMTVGVLGFVTIISIVTLMTDVAEDVSQGRFNVEQAYPGRNFPLATVRVKVPALASN